IPDNVYYFDFVTKAYRQYLKRDPDGPGLDFWVSHMQAGVYSDERLEAFFIGSDEYIHFRFGGSVRAWVAGMYNDLLLRAPHPDEVDSWEQIMRGGTPQDAVAFAFAASPERERLRVIDNYMTLLGRLPNDAEVKLWVDGFLQGVSNEDM